MKVTSPRIFETQDGSHSLFSEKHGVSYHSKYGAIQESQHVFIESGLYYRMTGSHKLAILEIGLGTGLNAYMSLLEAEKHQIDIEYTSAEAYPISQDEALQLNYPKLLEVKEWQEQFLAIHQSEWGVSHQLSPHFKFTKLQTRFEDLDFSEAFDVIYFDAFAPSAQPELWEAAIMEIMHRSLKAGGVLTTYCAKGSVKRTLRSIGFEIEALPGPPGKREMTRAIKKKFENKTDHL